MGGGRPRREGVQNPSSLKERHQETENFSLQDKALVMLPLCAPADRPSPGFNKTSLSLNFPMWPEYYVWRLMEVGYDINPPDSGGLDCWKWLGKVLGYELENGATLLG